MNEIQIKSTKLLDVSKNGDLYKFCLDNTIFTINDLKKYYFMLSEEERTLNINKRIFGFLSLCNYKYGELNIEHFILLLNTPLKTKYMSLLEEHYVTKNNNPEFKRCLDLYLYLGLATHELKLLYFYSKPGETCVDCFRRFVNEPREYGFDYLYNIMNLWISYYDNNYNIDFDRKRK